VAVFFENHLALGKNLPLNPGFRVESRASKMTRNISYYDTNKFPKTIEHKFPLFGISGEYKLTEKQKNIQVFLKHIVQLYLRISYLVRLSKNHLLSTVKEFS
jgi:hypothetical protein